MTLTLYMTETKNLVLESLVFINKFAIPQEHLGRCNLVYQALR